MDAKRIERHILEGLADVRLTTVAALLEVRSANDGDLEMTAKEQAFVIPWVEDKLEMGILLTAKDFEAQKKANSCLVPVTGTTVSSLAQMLVAKLAGRESGE